MKGVLIGLLICIAYCGHAQQNEIIKLAFQDRSNLDITTYLDNKRPKVYYVLNKTREWDTYRFHIDEDLSSDSVRKQLEQDEHSPYNNSCIFRDSLLQVLFDQKEKDHLYLQARSLKPKQLSNTFKVFNLIKSMRSVKNGFFFSVSEPIFSIDRKYAFIDIVTFKKEANTETLNDAYFGTTLLVFQNSKGKGWTRIKKINRLIL